MSNVLDELRNGLEEELNNDALEQEEVVEEVVDDNLFFPKFFEVMRAFNKKLDIISKKQELLEKKLESFEKEVEKASSDIIVEVKKIRATAKVDSLSEEEKEFARAMIAKAKQQKEKREEEEAMKEFFAKFSS